jgi:transaldolase/glucose-6-phosphate isomerase
MIAMTRRQDISVSVGKYRGLVDKALAEITDRHVVERIWAHDHTVWKPEPAEITNRLGWLQSPATTINDVQRVQAFADAARSDGYTHAVLLGMGGSSLAPEVFRKTFGVREGYLDLSVLDSTVPGAVLAYADRLDPARTLFVVSTKSGTTIETLSFFKFFYNWMMEAVGATQAGKHFIAITDPGSPLVDLAADYRFRETFLNDPNIGGRYAALSYVGSVPAALIGMDIGKLLDRAALMARDCKPSDSSGGGDNPGARLGAILGELATVNRDKVTFVASAQLASFGNWLEQLIAESTGKEGKGILPVVGETIGSPGQYGEDRLFVHLRVEGDTAADAEVSALERGDNPVVRMFMHDPYDLGGQIFLWEMAVVVAGHRLGINPFNQPDVEAAKAHARQAVKEYGEKGSFPDETPALMGKGIAVYGKVSADDPGEALNAHIAQGEPGSYVSLQAYLEPTPAIDAALQALRIKLRDRFRLATTIGYGPRFQHSTGQLYKGDAGHGLFLQFIADDPRDAPIPDKAGSPDSSLTFGVLKTAQVLGDWHALVDGGRRVIRFDLGKDALKGLLLLIEAV